jgi:formylmethanofuran dehydrogenase subunit E
MTVTYETLIDFHGHSCPGLAIGYRMTLAAMNFLSRKRSQDEELVAIVENDACGVDALQCISGCTFGKGNLLFKDYGKQVYTLYCRSSRKGVRVVFNEDSVPEAVRCDRDRYTRWLQTAPEDGFLSFKEVFIEEPQPARIMQSVKCEQCGEAVMVTRTRSVGSATLCIPCVKPYLAENISFCL